MKVNICGIPYTIISCQDQFDTESHFGMIDHLDCKIVAKLYAMKSCMVC